MKAMTRSARSSSHGRRTREVDSRAAGNRSTSVNGRAKGTDRRCRFCDRTHERSKTACPAYNTTCGKCKKKNHWAIVCNQTGNRPNQRGNTSSKVCELQEKEESLFALENPDNRRIYANLFVNNRKVRFLLDCGSTVNLLPISLIPPDTKIRPPRAPLRMFDKTELKTKGMITAIVRRPRTAGRV